MMKKIITSQWVQVLLGFVLIWSVLASVFPDQLITRSTRFMNVMDTEIPYENTFTIARQLAQGHVNLFNPFDGFSYAYAHLTNGVYTLGNILTAIGFVFTAGLVEDQAAYFHHFYSVFFFSVNALMLYLGGFLLAGLFTQRLWVKLCALVYLNVVFAQFVMNNGLMVNTLVGYLPLLMYLLIRAWQDPCVKHMVKAFLMLTLCIANAPLCGLAFFYQAIHGLMVMLVGSLLIMRFAQFKQGMKALGQKSWWVNHRWWLIVGIAGACVLMLPNLFWLKSLSHDFYIANSGLGETQGRLGNIFNIHQYFHGVERSVVNPKEFLLGIVDYRFPAWGWSWPFISAGALWLIILGLVFSRGILGWLLFASFMWVFCLNLPSQPLSILSWAHWINVLTNPFQFLVRSVHMADLMSIFFVWPLIVIGLNSIAAIYQREQWAIDRMKLAIVAIVLMASILIVICPWPVQGYVVLTGALVLLALGALWFNQRFLWVSISAIVLMVGVDLKALSHYVVGDLMKDRHDISLDQQNPMVFPWQNFYRTDPNQVTPARYGYLNSYGSYYSFSPYVERYRRKSSMYEPRHRILKGLEDDREGLTYLWRDGRMMFLADYAVDETMIAWPKILEAGVDRRIIIVDPLARRTGKVQTQETLSLVNRDNPFKQVRLDLPIEQGRIQLPSSFNPYFVSSGFTQDAKMWTLTIDNKSIEANMNQRTRGKVFADVSAYPTAKTAQLTMLQPTLIEHIDQWNGDQFKASLNASHEGWLVIHWPYDHQWKVKLDGKQQDIYRVSRYFLGFPITQGIHQVDIQYMPHHPLRIFIVLMCGAMMGIYGYLIKEVFVMNKKVHEHV